MVSNLNSNLAILRNHLLIITKKVKNTSFFRILDTIWAQLTQIVYRSSIDLICLCFRNYRYLTTGENFLKCCKIKAVAPQF